MEFEPKGVCSKKINFELDGDKITNVKFTGGCSGNAIGLSHLVEGMDVNEAIRRLSGVKCGYRATSCPDQLAVALTQAIAQ